MGVTDGERFIGPMPMNLFLSEFVPEAPRGRPAIQSVFTHSSVSQNEDEFASDSTFKYDYVLTPIPDPCYQSI